jgi:hypothetical protein
MKVEQQQQLIQARRLQLAGRRKWLHYIDPLLLGGMSLFIIFYIGKGFIEKDGYYNSPFLLLFLIFPVAAVGLLIKQYRSLNLRQVYTGLSKEENHQLVKDALRVLGWSVKVNNRGFIEAYTNESGWWTWENQMISILIADNEILFNSIGNVNGYNTQSFTWGQNWRNKRNFIIAINQLRDFK